MTVMDLKPGAMAALGAHQFRTGHLVQGGLVDYPQSFIAAAAARGTVRCRINPTQVQTLGLSASDERTLEDSWQDALAQRAHLSRDLRIGLEAYSSNELFDIRDRLAAAPGVESIYIADTSLSSAGGWHWPLKVGFLPDSASRALRAETAELYRHSQLLEILELGSDASSCDLLVVPGLEQLELLGPSARVGAAVALEEGGPRVLVRGLQGFGRAHHLSALAQVTKPLQSMGKTEYFSRFLDELSHDHPLDVALAKAGDAGPAAYELIANPRFLDSTRVTKSLDGIELRINDAARRNKLSEAEARDSLEIKRDIDKRLADIGFQSEEHGATVGADGVERMKPVLDKIQDKDEPRFLQAQYWANENGSLERRRYSFRAGVMNRIQVRIGPGDINWDQSDLEFDEAQLDQDETVHDLEILLIGRPMQGDQSLEPTSGIEPIGLPAGGGASDSARFDLDLPAEADRLRLTIQVLYRGRELQTARIDGRVQPGDDRHDLEPIRFVKTQPTDCDFGLPGDCQLYFRREDDLVIVRFKNHKEKRVKTGGLDVFDLQIRDGLYEGIRDAAQFEGRGIERPPGLHLMVMLAVQGGQLERHLLAPLEGELGPASDWLGQVNGVRVSSDHSTQSLPVELFYDGAPPDDDAELCPSFLASDNDGSTTTCNDCKADTAAFVCPSRFWGVSRVVEREIESQEAQRGDGKAPQPSRARQHLPRPERIIMAASDQVTDEDRRSTFDQIRAIDPVNHDTGNWKDWSEWGSKHKPSLLIALPHNAVTKISKAKSLEIGAADGLRIDKIREGAYFGFDHDMAGPIVLLLGCDTAAGEIGFHDFIGEVRENGASIVVGTLTTVLGRFAAPAARQLVREIAAPGAGLGQQPRPFGEVLRHVRLRMLREGNPMALAIVSFGDSRWLLQ